MATTRQHVFNWLAGLLVLAAIVVSIMMYFDAAAEEKARIDAQNDLARRDTTIILLSDSVKIVAQKLAIQVPQNIMLTGELEKERKKNGEIVKTVASLKLVVDKLVAKTEGAVTADTGDNVRRLDAALDTAGVHVKVRASVPAPPGVADVSWEHSLDTIKVMTALTESAAGAPIFRTQVEHAAGMKVQVSVDSALSVAASRRPKIQFNAPTMAVVGGAAALGALMTALIASAF